MELNPGSKLGPHEIVSAIGMGEVYRARDPRMRRDVALKVSAERFSDRFSREVHAVGALNHPNILNPYWNDDEKELLYFSLDQRTVMSAEISTKPIVAAKPIGQLPAGTRK